MVAPARKDLDCRGSFLNMAPETREKYGIAVLTGLADTSALPS